MNAENPEENPPNPLLTAATQLSEKLDADLVIMAGYIHYPLDYKLYARVRAKRKRKNVALILATFGGNPDTAYRISRILQKGYEKFTVIVDANCKSAGTLMTVGAHELVMSGRGELGPLDIQIGEADEPKERKSGLAPIQALKILQEQAALSYVGIFETLNENLQIRAKTAVASADRLIASLFSKIYQQLDPIRLAEYERAMTIMMEYGKRLQAGSKNMHDGALERLVKEYPDHSFAIDRYEAEELFQHVRDPSQEECDLLDILDELLSANIGKRPAFVEYFSTEPEQSVTNTGAPGNDEPQSTSGAQNRNQASGATAGRVGEGDTEGKKKEIVNSAAPQS